MTVPIVEMVEPAEDMNGTRDPTLKIWYKSYFYVLTVVKTTLGVETALLYDNMVFGGMG